jgi:hypothetical protein
MKKTLIVVALVSPFILSSCGSKEEDGTAAAQEVCDCYKKANSPDLTDRQARKDQQKACGKLNSEKWNNLYDNAEEAKKFNETISNCGKEMIKEAIKEK